MTATRRPAGYTALSRRGVAHLTVPNDVPPPGQGQMADLEAAARVLNDGEKIAILAGAGALHARDEVLAVADKLAAPIIKCPARP